MYMDDVEQFAKNEKEFEALIQTVRIYSDDIGMKFGIEVYNANNEKQKTANEGSGTTTKSRKIRTLGEKEIYKY